MKVLQSKGRLAGALNTLFSTGFFGIVGSTVLNKVISFLCGIILVRVLSKTEYGVYTYAFTIINYFILFNGLGISSCVLQLCVEQKDSQHAEYVYRVASIIGLIWDVILTIAIVLTACLPNLPVDGARDILIFLAPLPIFGYFVELQQQRLRSQFRTSEYALATNINSLSVIVLSVLGAIMGSSAGLSIGRCLSMVVTVLCVYKIFGTKIYVRPIRASRVMVVDIIKMSTTVCITNAVSQALLLVGSSFIGTFLNSPELTATYSTATTIPYALAFIPYTVVTYITPYFIKNASNRTWVIKTFLTALFAAIIVCFSVSFTCVLLADWIIPFVFGERYLDAIPCFKVLMVAFAFTAPLRSLCGCVLTSHRRYKLNFVSGLVSLVICVASTWYLLPLNGILGAAYGYVVAMVVGNLISLIGTFVFAGKPKPAPSV